MGFLIAEFIVVIFLEAFGFPWFFHKRGTIGQPFYVIAIVATIITAVLAYVTFPSFIPIILFLIGPVASVFIANRIYEKKRLSGNVSKPKAFDFANLYKPQDVFAKAMDIDREGYGFLRFRMDRVSYLVEDHKEMTPEPVICFYSRELKNETELMDLTNDFCRRYKDVMFGSNGVRDLMWEMADEVWHDDEGAYRLILVYQCDHGNVYKPQGAFYMQHIGKDPNTYQNRSFHVV